MTDVSTFPGLDPTFQWVSRRRGLIERIARRFLTPNGSIWYSPDDGRDVRQWLSRGMKSSEVLQLEGRLTDEASREEQLEAVQITVTPDTRAMKLKIHVACEDAEGDFFFELAIEKVSAELLAGETTS